MRAGDGTGLMAASALELLCRCYAYPLHAYIRRSGRDVHDKVYLSACAKARFLSRFCAHEKNHNK